MLGRQWSTQMALAPSFCLSDQFVWRTGTRDQLAGEGVQIIWREQSEAMEELIR